MSKPISQDLITEVNRFFEKLKNRGEDVEELVAAFELVANIQDLDRMEEYYANKAYNDAPF